SGQAAGGAPSRTRPVPPSTKAATTSRVFRCMTAPHARPSPTAGRSAGAPSGAPAGDSTSLAVPCLDHGLDLLLDRVQVERRRVLHRRGLARRLGGRPPPPPAPEEPPPTPRAQTPPPARRPPHRPPHPG